MSDVSDTEITVTLTNLFKDGLDLYNNLGKIDEPTNSHSVQSNVKKAMHMFEDATRLVSIAGMFSTNESIEEVATSDLQYLLLPALLGSLSLKLTSGDRKEIIDTADIYFKDFLQRCNDYGLTDYETREPKPETKQTASSSTTETESIQNYVSTRASKIQRFKEQKELKSKLGELKVNMDNEHCDEEIKRNYFLTMIKLYIYEAIDELSSIEMERPILDHMASIKPEEKVKPKRFPSQPLRPIIITKDAVQKAVFGAGYPGIPTMTVQEFYDKRVADGIFPDPTKPKDPNKMSLQEKSLAGIPISDDSEDLDKEKQIEEDDPERLERMRQMDEFKDEHRRGYGNRMNRS